MSKDEFIEINFLFFLPVEETYMVLLSMFQET